MFRQVAEEREKVLGRGHADTIIARYWTANSLYIQKKYVKAVAMYWQMTRRKSYDGGIMGDTTSNPFFIDVRRRTSTSTLSTMSIPSPPYGLEDARPLWRSRDGRSDPWIYVQPARPRIDA